MFSILVAVLFVVGPTIAITLPNGFTFDEKLYLKIKPRFNLALEKCETPYGGCSNDCSAQLNCDGNHIIDPTGTYQCDQYSPYCVQGSGDPMCAGNFPVSNKACLTIATNNFICSGDGQFPDPTDCSKYHVCNGTAHTIAECPASHQFTYDLNIQDVYMYPGDGDYRCRFRNDEESCYCDKLYCLAYPNTFTFRQMDYFHYAYCLEIGMMTKVVMFKCPPGTRHFGRTNPAGSVDCVPIGTL